jgi:UDP-N-acetylmuramoyl-tripeptide--D-alanyl-D-alanine ligase
MELSAAAVAAITGGTLIGSADARATSFVIDSRVATPGACFVTLVAERDGHDFIPDALERGARVVVVTDDRDHHAPGGTAIVRVGNAFGALADLGRAARAALGRAALGRASRGRAESGDVIVVGITGSAGKTGTKDLTAAALAPRFTVHASPGSYNNEAGVPLTLLSAPGDAEALVLEMGARAHGDITALCAVASPTVGVITNIGLAHAGTLGGREGVARVKGELLEALDRSGTAVLDAGDPATPGLATRTRATVLTVSAGDAAADVRATDVVLDADLRPRFRLSSPWGSGELSLAVSGAHQVVNASLAAAVALTHGVPFDDVAAALARVEPAPWRMEVARTADGVLVIDDAYNANPSSMAAALEALARVEVPGRHVAVLGEMRELGDLSAPEHAALGDLVGATAVNALVAVGPETAPLAEHARAAGVAVTEVPDAATALDAVAGSVRRGDVVLVKGSRAVGLELVATALRHTPSSADDVAKSVADRGVGGAG